MKPVWEGRRVLVCVGTGGVGKTTVAAALGVAAAEAGLKTLVMTIDPARRLANALGIESLGPEPLEIDAGRLEAAGATLRAPLTIAMPEVRRVFDELVERMTASPKARERIYANRMYQHFASMLSGSLEYAAVEKLYDVWQKGGYDLIVLDTPPAQNATSFLDAPRRIVDFLQHEALRWFLRPYQIAGRVSMRLLDVGSRFIYRTLGRFAGAETLRELAEFVLAFDGMYDGFAERAAAVDALLHADEVAFVLVAAPSLRQRRTAERFAAELGEAGLAPELLVLNRIRPPIEAPDPERLARELASCLTPLGPDAMARAERAMLEEIALAARDHTALAELGSRTLAPELVTLPELAVDVHELSALVELAGHLARRTSTMS